MDNADRDVARSTGRSKVKQSLALLMGKSVLPHEVADTSLKLRLPIMRHTLALFGQLA
jgi:hypothetical protein